MWPLLEGSDYSRAASNQRSTEIEEIWYIILSRDSIKLNAKCCLMLISGFMYIFGFWLGLFAAGILRMCH